MAFGFNLFTDTVWTTNGAIYQQGTWVFNKEGTLRATINVTEWLKDASRIRFNAVTNTPLRVILDFGNIRFMGYADKLNNDFLIDGVQIDATTLDVEIKALETGNVIYFALEKEITIEKQIEEAIEQTVPQQVHAAFFAESKAITLGTTPIVLLRSIVESTDETVAVVMITITGQASTAQTLTIRLTNNGQDVVPIARQYNSAGYQVIGINFLIPFEAGIHELIVWGNVDTGTFSIPNSGAILVGLARNTKETVVGGMPIVTLAQETEAYHRKIITEQQSTVSRQVPISSILEQSIFPTQITQITIQCDVTLSEG